VFPVLVIDPCDRDWPEECSLGTNPTNAPIVDPVNRVQSPISTANPNPVRTEIPRRHPSRRVTAVKLLSPAITVIASSNRSRRSVVSTTASYAAS